MSKIKLPLPDLSVKPAKPSPDFPLFPHANGTWAKKIRGKLHYFGPWGDPGTALARYEAEKDDLHAGRHPRTTPAQREEATVKDVANAFLNHKLDKQEAGELSPHTFTKYRQVCDLLVDRFGKSRLVSDLRGEDFAGLKNHMTSRWGPLRVWDVIQHVRSVFKHAFEAELIDRPIRFGPGFDRPSQKTLRLHRAKQGPKLFSADQIRQLLLGASVPMRAMILLGINAGFGNADCGSLPISAVSLDTGWLDFPRPKTGLARRALLWPETVEAIREALSVRPKPKAGCEALVFITKYGNGFDSKDAITQEVKKLLGPHRKGIGFYTLRHTFRTIADGCKDQPAIDHIMGHCDGHVSNHYREGIADARLRAVSDHVRQWLFGSEG